MIHVDRSSVPKPVWWNSPDFTRFLEDWADFHHAGGTRGTQKRASSGASIDRVDDWTRRALPVLLEGFHGKCAYTEEPIDEETGVVVFHRPLSDAIGLESDVSPEHYWWLLGDWDNWYPASQRVASVKGTSFPVVGPRTDPPAQHLDPIAEMLHVEHDLGLLLDPGRDYPSWHLEFMHDGTVRGREHPNPENQRLYDGRSRGMHTIQRLDLNNPDLVSQRQRARALSADRFSIGDWLNTPVGADDELNVDSFVPDVPFATHVRQGMADRLLVILADNPIPDQIHGRISTLLDLLTEELAAEIAYNGVPWRTSPLPLELWDPLRPIFHREWPELDDEGFLALIDGSPRGMRGTEESRSFDLDTGAMPDLYDEPLSASIATHLESRQIIERTERVERIEIKNFKAIERLEIDLSSEPVSVPMPFDPRRGAAGATSEEITATRWTALLGENGSGKSCCLQALGLALAADTLPDLLGTLRKKSGGFSWSDVLRRGTDRGRIFVRFTGGSVLDLRFSAKRYSWHGPDGARIASPPRMMAYVRGYGATRLLDGGPLDGADEHVRLANLYDPHADVLDAERWLLDLEEGDFNVAALTLSGFLKDDRNLPLAAAAPQGPDAPPLMTREDGEVLVGGDPLSYLSDGYRAVITLVCDIMAGLGAGLSDLRNATGIVLIDELGSHLHPRWKMEITGRLRRELPNVQFFVSTHEPLCLRGLFGGEVIRVRKSRPPRVAGQPAAPGAVELERVARSPSDFRVDQLLTSEFFGLDTTIDPDLDRRFQAYYRLLAMEPEDRERRGLADLFDELRTHIQKHGQPVLGFTRRDQLVYEAIDAYLAETPELSTKTRQEQGERKAAALKKVREIWSAREAITGSEGGGGRSR